MAAQRSWRQTAPWSVCTPPNSTGSVYNSQCSDRIFKCVSVLLKCDVPSWLQETLVQLLEGKPSCYSQEIQQLHNKHQKHFSKWMLQLQSVWFCTYCMCLNVMFKCLYENLSVCVCVGWDSACWFTVWAAKKLCLRTSVCPTWLKKSTLWSMDSSHPSLWNQSVSAVVLVSHSAAHCDFLFFPHHIMFLYQILNTLTCEVLEHQGSFRTPSDQIQYITQTLKDSECVCKLSVLSLWDFLCCKWKRVLAGPDLHVYLLIHNIDGLMLRGEKTQSALGQLASLPNLHLVASIDHINAPLGGCLLVFCCVDFSDMYPCRLIFPVFPSVGPVPAEPV